MCFLEATRYPMTLRVCGQPLSRESVGLRLARRRKGDWRQNLVIGLRAAAATLHRQAPSRSQSVSPLATASTLLLHRSSITLRVRGRAHPPHKTCLLSTTTSVTLASDRPVARPLQAASSLQLRHQSSQTHFRSSCLRRSGIGVGVSQIPRSTPV